MENFEKMYYEASSFWEEGVLEDENNLERITKTIELIPQQITSLLDAGCGNGLFLNTLSKRRPLLDLKGFDRSQEAIKHVLVPCELGDVSNINFENDSFDCTTCLEVIEHIPYKLYSKVLLELARVTKKYIIISVPFEEDLSETATQCPECRSIFNANLHLRSYNEKAFKNIFANTKFEYKKHFLCGESVFFKFHKQYKKIFYPNQYKKWNSPICPFCGYQEEKISSDKIYQNRVIKKNNLLKNIVTFVPKQLWPKEKKYYWIVGLFEKTT